MGRTKEPQPGKNAVSKKDGRTAAAKERRHPVRRVFKYASITLGSTVLFIAGTGIGYVSSMLKGLPSISPSTFANDRAATVVYDRNGKEIGSITSDGDRQPITSLNQVSNQLVNAFIAAEDKTFYSNIGINPLAMGRAVMQDVMGHRIESGASTITQQTVKLAVFPKQERTTHRKVQEIALALELNHLLSKDEIMTDYMNWVYMGQMGSQNVYGVKTASEILFHKSPAQLNLPEAAFLAAIPNNASLFSPYQFPKHTIARQHYILNQMLDNHMISQSDFDGAMKFNVLKEVQKAPSSSYGKYPYLMVLEIEPRIYKGLVEAGIYDNVQQAAAAVPTAGYKIYTTIDLKMQTDVDHVLQNKQLFAGTDMAVSGTKQTDMYEAGVTLIDNQTGGILAIGGGRDFTKDGYDHSDLPRQPGSSIKPLLDYGPAIDTHRITAGTVFDDAPVDYAGFSPKDDEGFSGIVTAREALTLSMNVPAVRILNKISPSVGLSYLSKMGITTSSKNLFGQPTLAPADNNLNSAIGGLTNGLTVQQMTSAYTVFPNQGIWHQSYMISKIVDQSGSTIFTPKPQVNQVFSPQTSYIMTDIMHDVVTKGTAAAIGAHFPGYMISGKTGTTDNRTNGWFIGYTSKYTMGLWMGYNHNQAIPWQIYNLKFDLWNDIMDPILSANPPTSPWQMPSGIVTQTICNKSGLLPTQLCQTQHDVYSELFIDGTQPTTSCNVMVQANYVVIGGKKYLATTNTPPNEMKSGIFLKPPFQVPDYPTADSGEYLPTQADPRGGTVIGGATVPSVPTSSLPAPSDVTAVFTGTGVKLNWSSVPGATSYTIWRSTSSNGPFTKVAGPSSGTSFTDSSLPSHAGALYYEVYALSSTAMSQPSNMAVASIAQTGGGSGDTNNNTTGDNQTTEPGAETNKVKAAPSPTWIPGQGFFQ